MRPVHWLFAVSVALFVTGLGFVIAGGRVVAARSTPAAVAPVTTPVATVRQIMNGIVNPAATTVFKSVGTVVTASGTEDWAPRTGGEWDDVGNSAAALIESGNLLMMGTRAVDKEDWIRMSQALADAGLQALKATQARSPDGVMAAGEAIYDSCNNCHRQYERGM